MSGSIQAEMPDMTKPLEDTVEKIADWLAAEAKTNDANREILYMASKLLRAFEDMFAPTWADVEWAEQMRKDREEDRRNGRPWNFDGEVGRCGTSTTTRTMPR